MKSKVLLLLSFCFLALLSCSLEPDEPSIALLSIACSYRSTNAAALRGPETDAREMEAVLQARHSGLTGMRLTDPTREEVETALKELSESELTIVYYSGHGWKDGSWVLPPEDGEVFGDDGLVKQELLLKPNEIWKLLDRRPGCHLLISDSCYSGALVPDSSSISTEIEDDGGSMDVWSPSSTEDYALVCTTKKNTGKEHGGAHPHGYFTEALLGALGWSCSQQRLVSSKPKTLDELLSEVKRTQRVPLGVGRRAQHPLLAEGWRTLVL